MMMIMKMKMKTKTKTKMKMKIMTMMMMIMMISRSTTYSSTDDSFGGWLALSRGCGPLRSADFRQRSAAIR